MAAFLRKTRFVCVSDTHNNYPKLPAGDVLIHAGDLTKQGTLAELERTVEWMEKADFEVKIVIAGNHDITLDKEFYADHGPSFHNQYPQVHADCLKLLQNSPTIKYLNHEAIHVRLTKESGPKTSFKIFGSPFSPKKRLWAFQYSKDNAPAIWGQIPLDVNVIITHTPPKFHCDESKKEGSEGCEALRQALWRIRPQLAICGHVHDARGAELVQWDLAAPNIKYKEKGVAYWINHDSKSKKQDRIDLTRKGGEPIENDGQHPLLDEGSLPNIAAMSVPKRTSVISKFMPNSRAFPPATAGPPHSNPAVASPTLSNAISASTSASKTMHQSSPSSRYDPNISSMTLGSATRGQGGIPPTGRSDLEALMGRLGRKETCIVNAAIMASSYPYTGAGGERYNKPIVVDLELPVWNGGVYAKDVMDWQQEAGPEAASRKQRGTSFAESVQWSETRSGQ